MSGVKSSEVYSVLNKVNGGLDSSLNIYRKDLEIYKRSYDLDLQRIETNISSIEESAFPEVYNAQIYYSDNIKNLKSKFESLKNNIPSVNFSNMNINFQEFFYEFDEIKRKAQEIQYRVKPQGYNSQEYRDAKNLNQELINLKKSLSASSQSYQEKVYNLGVTYKQTSDLKYQIENIIKQVKNLEADATFLKEQKDQADELRKNLQNTINNFDETILDAFLTLTDESDKYRNQKSNVYELINLSDSEVINSYSDMQGALIDSQQQLTLKYESLSNSKAQADKMFKEFIESKDSKKFIDCLSNKITYSLFEFIEKYQLDFDSDIIMNLEQQFDQQFKAHNFDQAVTTLEELNKIYIAYNDDAIALQENMRNSVVNAVKIEKAMKSLMYDVKISSNVDGSNPRDGFVVHATLGNDVIDFSIDETGEIAENGINHVDRNGNDAVNCETSFDIIKEACIENGMYIHDIKKNGVSVLGKAKSYVGTKITQKKQTQQTSVK